MDEVNDGHDYSPQGKGKIKTGPRSLDNTMRLRQRSGSVEGTSKKCSCGAVHDGDCPMC